MPPSAAPGKIYRAVLEQQDISAGGISGALSNLVEGRGGG